MFYLVLLSSSEERFIVNMSWKLHVTVTEKNYLLRLIWYFRLDANGNPSNIKQHKLLSGHHCRIILSRILHHHKAILNYAGQHPSYKLTNEKTIGWKIIHIDFKNISIYTRAICIYIRKSYAVNILHCCHDWLST